MNKRQKYTRARLVGSLLVVEKELDIVKRARAVARKAVWPQLPQGLRDVLAKAVEENLKHPRELGFEKLAARYSLPMDKNRFGTERARYIEAFIRKFEEDV